MKRTLAVICFSHLYSRARQEYVGVELAPGHIVVSVAYSSDEVALKALVGRVGSSGAWHCELYSQVNTAGSDGALHVYGEGLMTRRKANSRAFMVMPDIS